MPMKNLYPPPAWDNTPRTNALLMEIQSTPIPFDMAFWRLLELTRNLEVETGMLPPPAKPKPPGKLKRKMVARKETKGATMKLARKS